MRIFSRILLLSLLVALIVGFFAANQVQAQVHHSSIARTIWKQSWVEFRRFVDVAPFTIGTAGPKKLVFTVQGSSDWLVDIEHSGDSQSVLFHGYTATDSSALFTVTQPGTYTMAFAKAGTSTSDGKLLHIDYALVDAGDSAPSYGAGKQIWKQSWVEFRRFVDVAPFTIGTAGPKKLVFTVQGSSDWLVDIEHSGDSQSVLFHGYTATDSSALFTVTQPGTYTTAFAKAGTSTSDGKLLHIDYALVDA